jgi:hypothetical protein
MGGEATMKEEGSVVVVVFMASFFAQVAGMVRYLLCYQKNNPVKRKGMQL